MLLLRWLATRLTGIPWIIKIIASLVFVPIAFVLKLIGLPIMAVLSMLALPVLFLLFIFGLPIFFVLVAGGAIMGLVFAALSIGVAALKIAIFVVLPVLLIFKLLSWMFGAKGRDVGGERPAEG